MISGNNYDDISVNNFLLTSSGNRFIAWGNLSFLLFCYHNTISRFFLSLFIYLIYLLKHGRVRGWRWFVYVRK